MTLDTRERMINTFTNDPQVWVWGVGSCIYVLFSEAA
jgi:hypothetical protein